MYERADNPKRPLLLGVLVAMGILTLAVVWLRREADDAPRHDAVAPVSHAAEPPFAEQREEPTLSVDATAQADAGSWRVEVGNKRGNDLSNARDGARKGFAAADVVPAKDAAVEAGGPHGGGLWSGEE